MSDSAPSNLVSRVLHDSFLASVIFKAALGLGQMVSALVLGLASKSMIVTLVVMLTGSEIEQDPTDPLALWLLAGAQHFSVATQTFYVIYFAGHGLLNLAVAVALLMRLRWSYPVSIVVLAGFVVYQIDRFMLTNSPVMLALSAFDLIIIALVWREYRLILREDSIRKGAATAEHESGPSA